MTRDEKGQAAGPNEFQHQQLNALLAESKHEVHGWRAGTKEWVTVHFETENEAELFVDWVGCRYDDLRCDIDTCEGGGWSVEVYP
jgi:hypothetical protein